MKRKPQPKLIGAFIVAAGAVLVGMVIFFGAVKFAGASDRFIVFFDQSVDGLNRGSPVKFRGVPVGSVEQIMIRAEGQVEGSTAIPVIIRIDRSRLEGDLGVSETAFSPETIRNSMERGLVAQLDLESLITGQLFVELSFDPERVEYWEPHLEKDRKIVEIPALKSSLDQITSDLAQLISDAGAIDLERLNTNVNRVLEEVVGTLEEMDASGVSASIMTASDSMTQLIEDGQLDEAINEAKGAFAAIRKTADSLNYEDGAFGESGRQLIARL
ncbi:MAG: MlaD family protein, partial [Opitutales bacterium]